MPDMLVQEPMRGFSVPSEDTAPKGVALHGLASF